MEIAGSKLFGLSVYCFWSATNISSMPYVRWRHTFSLCRYFCMQTSGVGMKALTLKTYGCWCSSPGKSYLAMKIASYLVTEIVNVHKRLSKHASISFLDEYDSLNS